MESNLTSKPSYYGSQQFDLTILWPWRNTFMLYHLIAAVLMVGVVSVPLCLLVFWYRFVKKAETRR